MIKPLKSGLRVAAVWAVAVLLGSCGYIAADTETLLARPTLNSMQAEVYAALEETLNIADIIYRYPQHGEYRSPFIFYDMDGDTRQECIVFYAYSTDTASTRAKILRQLDDGGWEAVRDISEESSQVNFVRFSPLLSQERHSMLIGWQGGSAQGTAVSGNFLGVYSFSDGAFKTEIQQQPYLEYLASDFDGDGLEEVVATRQDADRSFHVTLLGKTGQRIDAVATLPLNGEADILLGMVSGTLGDGTTALYIDELRIDTTVATEVIRVDGGLQLLAGGTAPLAAETVDPVWENYTSTFRDEQTVSRDLDGDGVIEVPAYSIPLPGGREDFEERPLKITQLMRMTAENLSTVFFAVINEQEGYLLVYPEKWTGRVTVVRDSDNDIWQFYTLDDTTGDTTVEILRISALPSVQAETASGELDLGTRGSRRYIGYIPYVGSEVPERITEAELAELFMLLP